MGKRERLDKVLLERGLVSSRERAQELIEAGNVLVEGRLLLKPSALVHPTSPIELRKDLSYVSRGGLKLAQALEDFGLDVSGLICLDVGASTGGFTDCLLQAGATRVYAVDVGQGQLDWGLRQDPRVTVIEGKNARYLSPEDLAETPHLATVDVSFISLKLVLPAVAPLLAPESTVVALIKPQFEVGKGQVGRGGIVKDLEKHRKVLQDLTVFFQRERLLPLDLIRSPIRGAKGNVEYLMLLKIAAKGGESRGKISLLTEGAIDQVVLA